VHVRLVLVADQWDWATAVRAPIAGALACLILSAASLDAAALDLYPSINRMRTGAG